MARSKRRRRDEESEEEEEIAPSDADEAAELEEAQQQEEEGEDEEEQEQHAGNSSKRQRSEYPRGTVKKVRVYNFMTYGATVVEIHPGPRLNLVLGPNGTGKSSLVCALCLGLTGAPKLLGRADNVKDFITRGANSGWVETTLSGGPGRPDKVIMCEMLKTAEGYTQRWKINGSTKPMKDVKELVRSFNIQFDNLCQFLPQDKVVEFARMDPYELLIATEKAIGDSSLYDTHMQLIDKRNAVKSREQECTALQQQHDQLVEQNQKLEREYQRFEKRRKIIRSIQVIKDKLAWMEVKGAQERAKAAADEEHKKQRQLTEARKAAQGDGRPAKQRQQQAEAAKQKSADILKELRAQEQRAKKAAEKTTNEEQTVRQLRDQIKGLAAESAKVKHGIELLRKKKKQIEERLEGFGPIPDHSAEIRRLTEQQNELREQVTGLEADKMSILNELQAAAVQRSQKEAALREVATASYQRMAAIIDSQRYLNLQGLPQFVSWVGAKRQEGLFKGQVVGPLGVEVKVRPRTNPAFVDNLEQAVWNQMANFAVQNRDDERLLMNELERVGLRSVKVVTVSQNIDEPIRSETAALQQYGVVASLNELFDAPPLVRHALNNVCYLDTTYVSSNDDLDAAKRMMETHKGVRNVYTPRELVTYVASAYGGRDDAAVKTSSLNKSRILGGTGAVGDVNERKQQLESQRGVIMSRMSELEGAQRAAEAAMAPLQEQIDALQQEKNRLGQEQKTKADGRRKLQTGLKQAEKLLSDRESAPDPLQQAPQLETKVKAALSRHQAAVSDLLAATQSNWALMQQQVVAELTMRELDMQAKAMLAHFEAQRAAVSALEGEHRAAFQRAKALMEAYKRAKQEAEEDHPLDNDTKAAFGDLSDDTDELRSDLQELEDKVASITVSNPRVAQEYSARKAEIDSKSKQLSDLTAQLQQDTAALDTLKTSWLPELQRVVGQINDSFSTNFSEIGCAGEVHLAQHEDYDKFAIQIKVKFRDSEQLQVLTAHRQSGGERSVSTILYLIALQGVTVTPFRVVDEINQGMDPNNERKVFEQLVTASCKEGTPQCFLLTPKLLPDLTYTEDITTLHIFNGGLVSPEVAGKLTRESFFGAQNMRLLQQGQQQQQQQQRAVPVAG